MIEVGAQGADFSLLNANGELIKNTDFLGKKLVIYFYPKDNTPGCSTQAVEFSALLKEFNSLGVNIVGVSKDSVASHKKFISSKNLTIELLSDESMQLLDKYGVWREKVNFGKTYMGIVRSTFILDEAGLVIKRWKSVKTLGHARKVLDFIAKLAM